MGASARFNTDDTFPGHNRIGAQEFRILFCIDVVGNDSDAVAAGHLPGQAFYERGLSGTDRTGHAYFNV